MWELDCKEGWRFDVFEWWCWRRFSPSTARRTKQSTLQENNLEYSLEGLMLKLKLQYFSTWCEELTHWKRSWWGKDWRQEKRSTEDEIVGWHHQLDGHEFEQAPGVGDGQGSLVCCSPWGHIESDMTERLNWTELNIFSRKQYKSIDSTIPSQSFSACLAQIFLDWPVTKMSLV